MLHRGEVILYSIEVFNDDQAKGHPRIFKLLDLKFNAEVPPS